MENLDLPKELYWELKLEPASPPSAVASDLFSLNEPVATFLYDDNFANGITLMSDDQVERLQETASMELLSGEDLVVEFLDLKDDECLLDQKAPHLIDYETSSFPQHIDVVPQAVFPETKLAASVHNFHDGDSLFTLQQLTPPQSPPQCNAFPRLNGAQNDNNHDATALTAGIAYGYNNWVPASETDREAQLVDDIVNMRAQELQLPTNWQQYNDDCESQDSSSLGCSSASSSIDNSIADADEEWLPETVSSSPAHTIEEEPSPSFSPSILKTTKKKTRTYGREVEDRKIRKKEQNKNAATRYRQKKKIEMEHVLGEEQELLETNEKLRRTLSERRNESRYLRQLIREFYKGRKP